jgi:hypothetical protein
MNKKNFIEAVEGIAYKFAKTNPTQHVRVVTDSDTIIIEFQDRATLRDDWVTEKLTYIRREKHNGNLYVDIIVNDPKRKIMVVNFTEPWCDCMNSGVALCSPTDTYNENIDLAVAYANAYGENIPDYI